MKSPVLPAIACIAVQACLLGGPARADGPTGTWSTGDGRTLVRTESCGRDETRLCGYVVWLGNQGKRSLQDRRNPFAERQSRNLIGHQVLLGLRPAEGGRYRGWAYDAASGRSVFVTVSGDRASGLIVHGDLPSAICGYQVWTGVSDAKPGQLTGKTDTADGPKSDPEWASLKSAGNTVPARRMHVASGTADRKP